MSFFIGPKDKSCLLTYGSLLSATIGIFSMVINSSVYDTVSMYYGVFGKVPVSFRLDVTNYVTLGCFCLLLCGVFDAFDGRFARRFRDKDDARGAIFGASLDSLCDIVAFGVLPVAMFIKYSMDALAPGWLIIGVSAFYLGCCVTRLAWFDMLTQVGDADGFVGLASTYAAVILPCAYMIVKAFSLWSGFLALIMLCLGFAFVANIKMPRPSMHNMLTLGVVSLICCLALAVI